MAGSLPHATASDPSEGSGDIAGYLHNRESDTHVDKPPLKIRKETNVTDRRFFPAYIQVNMIHAMQL